MIFKGRWKFTGWIGKTLVSLGERFTTWLINQGEKDFVIERRKARGLGVSDKTTQWAGLDLTRGLGSEAM